MSLIGVPYLDPYCNYATARDISLCHVSFVFRWYPIGVLKLVPSIRECATAEHIRWFTQTSSTKASVRLEHILYIL